MARDSVHREVGCHNFVFIAELRVPCSTIGVICMSFNNCEENSSVLARLSNIEHPLISHPLLGRYVLYLCSSM